MSLPFGSFCRRKMCQVLLGAMITAGGASVSGILLLTIERYLSVRHLSFSKQFITRRKVIKGITFIWIFWIIYPVLGLTISWYHHQRSSYIPSRLCTLGAEFYNDHILLSLVIIFILHQIPMWYFQLKTFKVAKFFLIPTADRMKKKGSTNAVIKPDNEEKPAPKESETGEIRSLNCPSSIEQSEEVSLAEIILERSQNAKGQHRRHSVPLPKRESLKSEQHLNLPINSSDRSPFASLTSIVGELSVSNFRRYSSIRDAVKVKKILKRSQQMSKLVFSVMGSFSLCWWPYITALGAHSICPKHCHIEPEVFHVLGIFIVLNSFSNAFIYAAKSKDFRVAFKNIFSCKRNTKMFLTQAYSPPRLSCEHKRKCYMNVMRKINVNI